MRAVSDTTALVTYSFSRLLPCGYFSFCRFNNTNRERRRFQDEHGRPETEQPPVELGGIAHRGGHAHMVGIKTLNNLVEPRNGCRIKVKSCNSRFRVQNPRSTVPNYARPSNEPP